MVNPVVERATSDRLVSPDWSMNIGVCDICNRDRGQAKDIVKGIKKRLGSKNVKVQLLALILLETIVKNCGDFVHMNVAERHLLRDMVKIVKKKPDFHVKEKILILIDTWQEAFGGARARYPQYYAAYNELLHMGALFPKRTERSPPVFTPLQTQPLKRNPQNESDEVESSAEAELPMLSLKETQNARHIIDVLAEMLVAINPEKKEGLRQEVFADLVLQCRTYKKRAVHLVNSTSDESLLCEGLALNDNLQRVLDKYEALISGASVSLDQLNPKTSQALVPVDAPLTGTRESQNIRSTADAGAEAQFPAPVITNGASATTREVNPKFDLLSGDDFSTPTAQNFLAIVPSEPATRVSQQNVVAVVDTSSQNNRPQKVLAGRTYSFSPQYQNSVHFSLKKTSFDLNGNLPNIVPPQYEPMSQYAQGSIPAAERTYSASSKVEDSQYLQSHRTAYNPNGCIQGMVPPQYESMSLYAQASHPAAGQRYPNFTSLNPNRNVHAVSHPNIPPSQYEPMSPYVLGSSPTAGQTYHSSPQFQHFPTFNSNGNLPNIVPLQCEPTSPYSEGANSNPMWNGHLPQQQPSSRDHGAQIRHGGGLPPPPWETQAADSNQSGGMHYPQPQGLQTHCNNHKQVMSVYMTQKNTGSDPSPLIHGGPPSPMTLQAIHFEQLPQQQFQGQCAIGVLPHHEMAFMYPQQMPQQIYSDPMAQHYEYAGGYTYSYGYTQLQNPRFLDHRMSQLSVRDDGLQDSTVYADPSISDASNAHMPSQNLSKSKDIFEDLVSFPNIKPNKTTAEKK